MRRARCVGRAALLGLIALGCGGGAATDGPAASGQEPARSAGAEQAPAAGEPTETAAGEPTGPAARCADAPPSEADAAPRVHHYLYLGDEAFVLARSGGESERFAPSGGSLLDAVTAAVRDFVLRPSPDASRVFVIADDYVSPTDVDAVLGVLSDEGLTESVACQASSHSVFGSAQEALHRGG